jgi:hypothetical protein
MNKPQPTIRVPIDPSNPGQFFACCGLLELANRFWRGTEAWFGADQFTMSSAGTFQKLLAKLKQVRLLALEPDVPTTSPLWLPGPIDLRLDWWLDDRAGGSNFKTWAGQQKVVTIATAMQASLDPASLDEESLLNTSAVLYADGGEKIEPFYFDARRAAQSHSLDVGFSPDAQKMLMPVYSAVEFLCLVGLQRFRPARLGNDNAYEYAVWCAPLPVEVAAAAACGGMAGCGSRYRFPMLYRTKYLKGFLPAIRLDPFDGGNAYE